MHNATMTKIEQAQDEQLLRMDQAVTLVNLHPQTLRRYEREGKLPNTKRTPGGQRRFAESDLRRLMAGASA
jgi:DNA-binding transcriptional MerR regulator